MKQCPKCGGFELYEDEETLCPYCSTTLVSYTRKTRNIYNATPVKSKQSSLSSGQISLPEEPVFESRLGGRYYYRGVVVSISSSSRYVSNSTKWFNAFFKGQPYQSGNPVYETILRIEEISRSRIPDKMRSLIFYGELGELDTGDDVTISAVQRNGRFIAQRIVINDTESSVHTRGVITAKTVRVISILVVALVVMTIASIVSFFSSGGLWLILSVFVGMLTDLTAKLIVALAPLLVVLIVFRMFFPKRR